MSRPGGVVRGGPQLELRSRRAMLVQGRRAGVELLDVVVRERFPHRAP